MKEMASSLTWMKDVWAGNAEEAQRDITGRHLVCELAVRAVRGLFVLLLKAQIAFKPKLDFSPVC